LYRLSRRWEESLGLSIEFYLSFELMFFSGTLSHEELLKKIVHLSLKIGHVKAFLEATIQRDETLRYGRVQGNSSQQFFHDLVCLLQDLQLL